MKNLISGIIVIIIIIVAGAWLFNRAEPQEVSDNQTEETTTSATDAEESGQFLQVVPTDVGTPPNEGEAGTDTETDGEEAAETGGEEVTISIDDTGFTTTEVSIKAGTTVTFVNNGQALHWPASDVHPTHEILPEFDSNRGLQTGESYSHTFTEVGEWKFHDHLRPKFVGTITVTE